MCNAALCVQREAVSRALGAEDFLLLHGPPGTGKTTAVIEVRRIDYFQILDLTRLEQFGRKLKQQMCRVQ